ncbi:MAG TPA: hypothetical protein VN043_16580 [Rhodanobacter sp.]|nr:hypothetical protein [Rhodanobacter sp.]
MIELEIQALSERREGLLIEVGRLVVANGFTLQRQRLVQDPHGTLLTIVVRGPPRKKRGLKAALEACDRIISFDVEPFVEGEQRPHFAASRTPLVGYVPAPLPAPVVEAAAVTTPKPAPAIVAFDEVEPASLFSASESATARAAAPAREPVIKSPAAPEFEFILPEPSRPPVATAPVDEAPFVEVVPLEPDQVAVDKLHSKLTAEYPLIMPHLLAFDHSLAEGARESSLHLAGQHMGRWVFEREHAPLGKRDLNDALEQIGVPALSALAEIELEGSQLHIRHSPLCAEAGHSGCTFFSGFLEGLLGPALTSSELSIFAVCCRSYGADECVLALSN